MTGKSHIEKTQGDQPTRIGRSRIASAILVLAGATCWGVTGLANRMLTPLGFTQMEIVFIRSFIGAVALLVLLLAIDRSLLRIRIRDLWCFLGTGIVSLTVFSFSYFCAMQELSLSAAAVLLYTAPIFVTLMSAVVFRERINARKILALVMVFGGAALMCGLVGAATNLGGAGSISARGIGFGLLSGFAYALYTIFSRFALNRSYRPLTIAFYTLLFAAIASAVFANPIEIAARTADVVNSSGFGVIGWELFMGIITCSAAYAFYTLGLAGLENGPASIIATWELVVATLVSIFIFTEPFGVVNLVGMVLVIAGIVIMNVTKRKRD
ncbi:MAG: EamA family transporter [Coriobacteriales bacterium]|nr:EamA family transporter [Coriobacteriales bacterium]